VANYANNFIRLIYISAHRGGARQARVLRRRHGRLGPPHGSSIALDVLYPYPDGRPPVEVAGVLPQPRAPAAAPAIAHG
jgi:hypothetical protein